MELTRRGLTGSTGRVAALGAAGVSRWAWNIPYRGITESHYYLFQRRMPVPAREQLRRSPVTDVDGDLSSVQRIYRWRNVSTVWRLSGNYACRGSFYSGHRPGAAPRRIIVTRYVMLASADGAIIPPEFS